MVGVTRAQTAPDGGASVSLRSDVLVVSRVWARPASVVVSLSTTFLRETILNDGVYDRPTP